MLVLSGIVCTHHNARRKVCEQSQKSMITRLHAGLQPSSAGSTNRFKWASPLPVEPPRHLPSQRLRRLAAGATGHSHTCCCRKAANGALEAKALAFHTLDLQRTLSCRCHRAPLGPAHSPHVTRHRPAVSASFPLGPPGPRGPAHR